VRRQVTPTNFIAGPLAFIVALLPAEKLID
jgi:hypothetical protein